MWTLTQYIPQLLYYMEIGHNKFKNFMMAVAIYAMMLRSRVNTMNHQRKGKQQEAFTRSFQLMRRQGCVAKYAAERHLRVMNEALQSDLLTILQGSYIC